MYWFCVWWHFFLHVRYMFLHQCIIIINRGNLFCWLYKLKVKESFWQVLFELNIADYFLLSSSYNLYIICMERYYLYNIQDFIDTQLQIWNPCFNEMYVLFGLNFILNVNFIFKKVQIFFFLFQCTHFWRMTFTFCRSWRMVRINAWCW